MTATTAVVAFPVASNIQIIPRMLPLGTISLQEDDFTPTLTEVLRDNARLFEKMEQPFPDDYCRSLSVFNCLLDVNCVYKGGKEGCVIPNSLPEVTPSLFETCHTLWYPLLRDRPEPTVKGYNKKEKKT